MAMTEKAKDLKTKVVVKLKALGYLTVEKRNQANGRNGNNVQMRIDGGGDSYRGDCRSLKGQGDEQDEEGENEKGSEKEEEKEEKDRNSISMSPTTSDDFELVCHTDASMKQPFSNFNASGGNSRDGGFVDLKRKATATARLDSVRNDMEKSRMCGRGAADEGLNGSDEVEKEEKGNGKGKEDQVEGGERLLSDDDMVVVSHPQNLNNSGELHYSAVKYSTV